MRDVYAYLATALAVAVFLGLGIASRWKRVHWLLLVSGLLVFGLVGVSAGSGARNAVERRWVFPLFNVIGQRVLTDPVRTSYFTTAGMPMSDALRGRTGAWASSDGFAFFLDPELAQFRRWATEEGKATYVRYLLAHPGYTFGSAWTARRELLHLVPRELAPYYPPGFAGLAPRLCDLEASLALSVFPLVVALPMATWQRRRGWRAGDGSRGALAVAALVPLPVLMLAAFHGDAMEVARHAVPAAVYFRVWIVFAAWLVLDGGATTRN